MRLLLVCCLFFVACSLSAHNTWALSCSSLLIVKKLGRKSPLSDLSKAQLIKVVQSLELESVDVSASALQKNRTEESKLIIFKAVGVHATAAQYYYYVKVSLGWKWADWLTESDVQIKPKKVVNPIRKSQIITLIKSLQSSGLGLSATSWQTKSDKWRAKILEVSGHSKTPSQIYRLAISGQYDLKKWGDWLGAAGFSSRRVREDRLSVSSDRIVNALKAMYAAGHSVNARALFENQEPSARKVLKSAGVDLSPRDFYLLVKSRGDAWSDWLVRSNLPIKKIVVGRRVLTDEEIIFVIQHLHTLEQPLNYSSLRADESEASAQLIESLVGVRKTFKDFVLLAGFVKPWRDWLSDAGLNVAEIQINGKLPFESLNQETQNFLRQAQVNKDRVLPQESVFTEQDGWVAVAPETSEDILIKKDFDSGVESFLSDLSPYEQEIFYALVDAAASTTDFTEILSGKRELLDYRAVDVQSLILKLRSSSILQELLDH